jgi:hypothetical protein
MFTFPPLEYDRVFDNEEVWYSTSNGCAMLINDCQLLDC